MYRAKVKSDDPVVRKRWAFGDKVTIGDRVFIVLDDSEYDKNGVSHGKYQEVISGFIEVIPASVGQSMGLKDYGYYENDILLSTDGKRKFVVVWDAAKGKWYLRGIGKAWRVHDPNWAAYKVIGNTPDNPELLEQIRRMI